MLAFAAVSLPAQAQTLTVLYSFTGGADGTQPMGLVLDSAGNLFGTALYGGDLHCGDGSGCGTVFELAPTGTLTILHTFTGGADGSIPWGTLLLDSAGNLFGTTIEGGNINCSLGTMGCGTVFKLDTAGNKTMLYVFAGSLQGSLPYGTLVQDATGNLYGTTAWGGIGACDQCGTVFKMRATGGAETVLHAFTARGDGDLVYAGVIRDAAGNLYGTTYSGGTFNGGTVFKVDSTGKESVLHSFGKAQDGISPTAGLLADGADLYGTTLEGGAYDAGMVFKLDKTGVETALYSFTNGADGGWPHGNLIRDAAGNLYGTASSGGTFGYGAVFKLDSTGKETVLHSFDIGDGQGPSAGLIRDAAGNLYGTTLEGGAFGYGTVFKITP